jgi:hypothetical protein
VLLALAFDPSFVYVAFVFGCLIARLLIGWATED